MYGRYTQELGVYAKEEAARLRESGQRRSVSDRSRTLDLLEYDKGRCAKCRSKFHTTGSTRHICFLQALIPSLRDCRVAKVIKFRNLQGALLKSNAAPVLSFSPPTVLES
ncbi:Chloride channel protein 2, partial [Nibea albiflora]